MNATAPSGGSAGDAGEAMIRLEGVGKKYADGTVAVHELDLEVLPGEVVVPGRARPGCGKSTTLKMINRLIEPTSGRIFLEGRDVTSEDPVQLRRRIGYVIQQIGLFPHQKIATNVATVPSLIGTPKAQARERARELLALVGLDPDVYADRYPHQLSGGQQQRVGVARALAADPPVLLMDEPFAAVDPIVRARLQDEFLRLQDELGKTVVLVTHDIDEAVKMGDKVAILAQGGQLAQFGTPAELLGHPADDFVADFVGSTAGLRRLTVTKLDREPPRAARRRRHRRPRRRHRPRLHARAGARRTAARRPSRWSASRRARSSSASSPPTASTAPSAPPSPTESSANAGELSRTTAESARKRTARTDIAESASRRDGLGASWVRSRQASAGPAAGQEVAMSSSDGGRRSRSGARRSPARARRRGRSPRRLAPRTRRARPRGGRPRPRPRRPGGPRPSTLRIASAARPWEATTADLELGRRPARPARPRRLHGVDELPVLDASGPRPARGRTAPAAPGRRRRRGATATSSE